MSQDVLDLLVVGGGPGGTAAAFRAQELGMKSFVIDYDDLMKRIRDYSKDKLILPGFGGGDRMRFPKGDSLVSELCFSPIDKDDMCREWKELYRRHQVNYQVGIELTGLERRGGIWEAQAWDHSNRADVVYHAKHVVLAIGRGVPRRFDIPGNADGIAFRLGDPRLFVGQPACVIGGGTSAAEAVIAISGAKAAESDPSPVYWSYRGDRMPRVSKALAEVFFGAYVGNGNIRYYPQSEPAAVVVGNDRREYLSIRIDRRLMEGRPAETTHLEFPKSSCMACIGEDIPESLFDSIGVPMVVGGPRSRKRMAVTRYRETVRPNLYLVGDILSQAYFEVDDFSADPATFREVKHRGNIKSALRDGVLVAQVIRQKLDGSEVSARVEDAEERETDSHSRAVPRPSVLDTFEGPPQESMEPVRRMPEGAGYLVRLLPGGVEEDEFPIRDHSAVTIGREGCDLIFPEDTTLAPRHASVVHNEDGYFLRDDGSTTGVFLRVPSMEKMVLQQGDVISAGRQFLLFSAGKGKPSFTHYDAQGREVGHHELPEEHTIVLGREAPDVTLNPDDKTLSRRQLALSVADGGRKILIKDLKSVNGTYLRLRSARKINHGHQFRVGQQRFALNMRGEMTFDEGHESSQSFPALDALLPRANSSVPAAGAAPVAGVAPAPAAGVASAVGGAASVTFQGLGKTCPAMSGQTICAVAEAHGIPINAECHSGICGSDPIRIISGIENLEGPASDQESETLEDLCELEAGGHRLACMARIRGPVTVEIL